MLRPLLLIANWIGTATEGWREKVARYSPTVAVISLLEEQLRRVTVERDLLRARMVRVSPRHRAHYRPQERLDILWHAQRKRAVFRTPPGAAPSVMSSIGERATREPRRRYGRKRPASTAAFQPRGVRS